MGNGQRRVTSSHLEDTSSASTLNKKIRNNSESRDAKIKSAVDRLLESDAYIADEPEVACSEDEPEAVFDNPEAKRTQVQSDQLRSSANYLGNLVYSIELSIQELNGFRFPELAGDNPSMRNFGKDMKSFKEAFNHVEHRATSLVRDWINLANRLDDQAQNIEDRGADS